MRLPKEYTIKKTGDNSVTLWSTKYKQACHSMAGAYSETLYNYIQGCNLINIKKECFHKDLNILEIGFGTGLGAKSSFKLIDSSVKFFSFEQDELLIKWVVSTSTCPLISKLKKQSINNLTYYKSKLGTKELMVFVGDARKTLIYAYDYNLIPKIIAVYFDPFCPKENPELWTIDIFKQLFKISKKDAILSTYSASSLAKHYLKLSGWHVTVVKGYAGKRESIRAKK